MSSSEQSTLDCHVQLLVPVAASTSQQPPQRRKESLTPPAREKGSAAASGEGFELADARLTLRLDDDGALRVRFAHTSTARQLLEKSHKFDKNECTSDSLVHTALYKCTVLFSTVPQYIRALLAPTLPLLTACPAGP